MKELDLQSRIIDEIREAGGWARKWASVLQTGVPDIIAVLPYGDTVFLEVKMVNRVDFDYMRYKPLIKTTKLQERELKAIRKAHGESFVLLGVQTNKEGRLYLVEPGQKELKGNEPYKEWKRSKIRTQVVELLEENLWPRSTN